MHAGAVEADEDAEFGRCPLRTGGAAVTAAVVIFGLLDFQELFEQENFMVSYDAIPFVLVFFLWCPELQDEFFSS